MVKVCTKLVSARFDGGIKTKAVFSLYGQKEEYALIRKWV
jgi:hypothetical protein